PALIALRRWPGAVMLRNGQEFGEDYWMPDNDPGRVIPHPLRWNLLDDDAGRTLFWLHQRLLDVRRRCPSLRGGNFYPSNYDERWTGFNDQGYGVDVGRGVVIYHRWGDAADGKPERFMVAINFSGYDQYVDVPFPSNGGWEDRL